MKSFLAHINRDIVALATVLFLVLIFSCCKHDKKLGTDNVVSDNETHTFTKPVLDLNFADPTVIKAPDGFYYAYATNTVVNGKFVHIQIRKSKDLIDWVEVGDALPVKSTWAEKDFWAPHVLYDSELATYFLYYSGESIENDMGKCLGVATSKTPEGPFEDKGSPFLCGEGFINIDPMAFDDPKTGKKLLYWGSGFQGIKVQELSNDRLSFKEDTSPKEIIPIIANSDPGNYQKLVEGAWIYYHNGYYYVYFSGDNCCGDGAHYAVMIARSRNAEGPFETYSEVTGSPNNVILEKNDRWLAPGHNSIVQDAKGQEWIIYHAVDTLDRDKGRVMLIDKLYYKNGWPQIGNGSPSIQAQLKPMTE